MQDLFREKKAKNTYPVTRTRILKLWPYVLSSLTVIFLSLRVKSNSLRVFEVFCLFPEHFLCMATSHFCITLLSRHSITCLASCKYHNGSVFKEHFLKLFMTSTRFCAGFGGKEGKDAMRCEQEVDVWLVCLVQRYMLTTCVLCRPG